MRKNDSSGMPNLRYLSTSLFQHRSLMKHISILAFVLLNLLAANVLAQKNELRLDLRYWPANESEPRAGAALSYFRAVSADRLLGAKINFDTDEMGLLMPGLRRYTLNLDFVNRWVASGRGGQFFFDLGLSVLGQTDRIKPGAYFIECGTGLTSQKLQEINQLYEGGTTGTDFYFGFATAVGLEVRVGPKFLMCINTSCNVYHFENSIRPRFNPGLSLSHQF